MLKFLTHKLKTHSLNEENPHHKVEEDDHDSGTESDDEQGSSGQPEISMESEVGSVVTALSRSRSSLLTPASPYFLDSALPSDCDQGYDQHSSEEELEVINCKQTKLSTGQEKRKWSQVTAEGSTTGSLGNSVISTRRHLAGQRPRTECGIAEGIGIAGGGGGVGDGSSAPSSDDEIVVDIARHTTGHTGDRSGSGDNSGPTPVQFRTSPPRGTHRPHSAAHLVPHEASPRKRHRNAAPPRPCLDFEKMQQLKARAMTAWRHRGDTTGELSVYCW
ncbi:regulator of eph expression isoform X2 [Rhodnius prolixus]|uniref:regulator of eph expression isoform X2 n=1 Tax=Rhodnius prolixus TaxID=13249 RepID=UPI003D18ED5F